MEEKKIDIRTLKSEWILEDFKTPRNTIIKVITELDNNSVKLINSKYN